MLHNEKVNFTAGPTADVAAGTDIGFTALKVPGPSSAKYTIDELWMDVDAAVTADPTNFTIWTLRDETAGVNLAVRTYAAGSSTALSSEDMNLSAVTTSVTTIPRGNNVSGGSILSWVKTHGGTGVASRARVRGVLRRVAS